MSQVAIGGVMAMALGLSPWPWLDPAPGLQLQNLKIEVCHLVVRPGGLGTTTQNPTVFKWSDLFMISETYILFGFGLFC